MQGRMGQCQRERLERFRSEATPSFAATRRGRLARRKTQEPVGQCQREKLERFRSEATPSLAETRRGRLARRAERCRGAWGQCKSEIFERVRSGATPSLAETRRGRLARRAERRRSLWVNARGKNLSGFGAERQIKKIGSSGRTRTYNPSVNSRMLCH